MNLSRAIYYKDGRQLVVTEQEAEAVKASLLAGDKFVEVGGDFISADNIARIGSHTMTAEREKFKQADVERQMLSAGRIEEVEKLRAMKKKMAIEATTKEEMLALPMSEEQEENGEPMFYLNEYEEKVYS